MIDFIKIIVQDIDIPSLLNNDKLEFTTPLSQQTGELLENRQTAKYKGLVFEVINKSYLILSGSIHKFKNNGIHNADNFYFSDILESLKSLWHEFGINPKYARLKGLEYGVNIKLSGSPKKFIRNSLINYKGDQPSIQTFRGNGYMKEFEKQRYYVKIYDKGLQYHIVEDAPVKETDNILRIEQKVIKMIYLKDFGIITLADLLKPDTLKYLENNLLELIENLLIWNNQTMIEGLSRKDKNTVQNGKNPLFWVNLKEENRKKYYRELRKFKELAERTGANEIKKKIETLTKEKCNELLYINKETRDKLTEFLNDISEQKRDKLTEFSTAEVNNQKGQINPLYIELNCTDNKKVCRVTGLDISMQKETSKFLCTSGLKFYKEHNPETYSELEKRLSEKWKNESERKKLTELHHSIRNEYFNKIHNTRRRIVKLNEYPSIFDNFALIDKQYLKVARII